MLMFLGFVVIVGTLVLAGRQGENETAKIIAILVCGYAMLSFIADLMY